MIKEAVVRVVAFVRGVVEFRNVVTTHYAPEHIEAYDRGREFAHRVTLRRFDA